MRKFVKPHWHKYVIIEKVISRRSKALVNIETMNPNHLKTRHSLRENAFTTGPLKAGTYTTHKGPTEVLWYHFLGEGRGLLTFYNFEIVKLLSYFSK